jgi:regulator of sigma E protease
MLLVIFNIFIIVITFIFLIGFHEFGHCLSAKRLGISVARFAIGFGKPLWMRKARDGTEYALCAFPLGGYVKFRDQAEFDAAPIFKRVVVFAAGPFFNLIFAFFAYWMVFVIGVTQPIPRIEAVLPDSPAAKSGVLPQSEIIAVDHHPTASWAGVVLRLIPHLGKNKTVITLDISHLNQLSSHAILLNNWKLDPVKPDLLGSLGLSPVVSTEKQVMRTRQFSVMGAIPEAFREINLYLQFNMIILGKILTGVISLQSLAGPLTLFSGTLSAAHQGFVMYMAFLGFVSIGLAFANLLPIPGLDGAHLLYVLIEGITGKPLTVAVQVLLFRLGIILLSVLMFQALVNDLVRIF